MPAAMNVWRDKEVRRVVLVGAPNVGKSVIFNRLTGRYAVVSNYPGTTVEVSRGEGLFGDLPAEVVDTPGTYSLLPSSEEEAVTRRLLWQEEIDLLLHIVDTKNLDHSLSMTFALLEAGFPVILVLNMFDEAKRLGLAVDVQGLEQRLGIPCIAAIGITGWGIPELKQAVRERLAQLQETIGHPGKSRPTAPPLPSRLVDYPPPVEGLLRKCPRAAPRAYPFSMRAIALLFLAGDEEIAGWLRPGDRRALADLGAAVSPQHVILAAAAARRQAGQRLLQGITCRQAGVSSSWQHWLDSLTINPLTGIPILALVIYFLLYRFVGLFGAGVLVDFLDGQIFGKLFTPFVNHLVDQLVPSPLIQELLAHEFGILTLGVRYAAAVVFPIVTAFFASLALLEDSGYLPRLAYLADRVFGIVGLSGRAVIPLTLGFGCGTMATLLTRTLETRRERLIATFILALAVPCSAQLGVILALLSREPLALAVWAAAVGMVGIGASWLVSRLLPGPAPRFIMELPPLRWPVLSSVYAKTKARVSWYLSEIMPLFIWTSVMIWAGQITGGLQWLLDVTAPLMEQLGLPPNMARVFLYGFFRRDYGAAGLYDLQSGLTAGQLTVAAVTLTLFVPCIAQLVVMIKERGLWTALAILASAVPLAFLAGIGVSRLLTLVGMM
ncbi:MAG: ferrous iron transport protein B [Firmicutes bacterium]|jgi:ferrous iron transport protein B|nr:ferrous iron transport protein B [Bacillota bacterium]